MGEAVSSAVAAIKSGLGLPTDVNPGSSPGTRAVESPVQPRPTPAVQQVAAEARSRELAVPPPRDDIMAAKDKAIADAKARAEQLEASNESLMGKMTQLIEMQMKPPEKKPEPDPLPDDFKELPGEKQIEILAGRKAREIVVSEMTREREALQRNLGPILSKVHEHEVIVGKQQIQGAFPRFDYGAHEAELQRLAREMPALSAIERAKIVAQPVELMPATANVPVVEASLPSAATAAGQPRQRPGPQGPDRAQVLSTAADLLMRGRRIEANPLIDHLLHKHVRDQRAAALEQRGLGVL